MSKKKSVKKEEVNIKHEPKEEMKYTQIGYCNLIGASKGVRFVAQLKFKGGDVKTASEWKELFKKSELY